MCLAASRRTIRKHRRVVAIQHTIQKTSRRRFIHIALSRVLVKDLVKCKCPIFDSLAGIGHDGSSIPLDGIMFGWIEYSVTKMSYCLLVVMMTRDFSQALVVNDLDDRSKALLS